MIDSDSRETERYPGMYRLTLVLEYVRGSEPAKQLDHRTVFATADSDVAYDVLQGVYEGSRYTVDKVKSGRK